MYLSEPGSLDNYVCVYRERLAIGTIHGPIYTECFDNYTECFDNDVKCYIRLTRTAYYFTLNSCFTPNSPLFQ